MSVSPIRDNAAAAALSERLAEPRVAAALNTILDHADLLAVLVEGVSGLAERSETLSDTLAEGLTELRTTVSSAPGADQLDVGEIAGTGMKLAAALPKAAPGMLHFVDSGIIDRLIDSDVLSEPAVSQISVLARGLVKGSENFQRSPIRADTPVSLFRAMRDPDVARAMSFLVTVAKAIGRELDTPRR